MTKTTQKRNTKKSRKRTRKNRYIPDNLFDIFNNGVLFPFVPLSRLVQSGGRVAPKSPLSTDDNIATVEITKELLEDDPVYRELNDKYGDTYFTMSEMSDTTYGHPEIFEERTQEGGNRDEENAEDDTGDEDAEDDDEDDTGDEDAEDDDEDDTGDEDAEDDDENDKVTFKMLYQWDIYQKSTTDPTSVKTFKLEVNTSKEEDITIRKDMTVKEFLTKLYFSMEHTPFYVQLNNPQIDSFNISELNNPNITYETTMGELKNTFKINELNTMIQISNITL